LPGEYQEKSMSLFDPNDARFPWLMLVAILIAWIIRIRYRGNNDR